MTNTEKKGIIIDALQKAQKLVEGCNSKYSEKATDTFIQRVSEMLKDCQGNRDLEHVVFVIMSDTFDYLEKMQEGRDE